MCHLLAEATIISGPFDYSISARRGQSLQIPAAHLKVARPQTIVRKHFQRSLHRRHLPSAACGQFLAQTIVDSEGDAFWKFSLAAKIGLDRRPAFAVWI